MDVYTNGSISKTGRILKNVGFDVKQKGNYFSAVKKTKSGRYHILLGHLNKELFWDFHFDTMFHFMAFGVDYHSKPDNFFRRKLREHLDREKISYRIEKVNWINRRNRAMLTGFRPRELDID